MGHRSWINLLQKLAEVGEPLTLEDAVEAHPIDERAEPSGAHPVIDVAPAGRSATRPACLCDLRCWEMEPWVTPLPRVSSATLISVELMIRSNTARRVESASARMTVSTVATSGTQDKFVMAHQLVNTNV